MAFQNPYQLAVYLPSPQVNYRPGLPTTLRGQPYPPTSQYAPEPVGQSALFQTQSNLQVLIQELASAQRRLSHYTDLILSLYAELDSIRSIVCSKCKDKISPENLPQHPSAFASHISTVPSTVLSRNLMSQQSAPVTSSRTAAKPSAAVPSSSPYTRKSSSRHVNSRNTQLTTFRASNIPTTPSHSTVTPVINVPTPRKRNGISHSAETPHIKSVKKTAGIARLITKSEWSVVYNSEVEQMLDISFVHAFKHTSSVYAVRFSPDGNFLAAGLNYDLGRTHIYDMKTRSVMCALAEYPGYSDKKEYSPRGIWCVCFSPDGKYVVVGSSFEMIYIWEIATKRVLAAFKGHVKGVPSLDLSPNGRLLVSGSFDCSVRIWKIRDGSSKLVSTEGSSFTSTRFSPNGRYVAASSVDQFLRLWDVRSGQLVGKWNGHEKRIWCVAFSPDGKELVSGSWGGAIKTWDVSSLKVPASSSPTKESAEEDGILVEKNEKLEFDGHSGEVHSVGISPDGKWVITGSSDKCFRIWDMQTAVRQCTLEGHADTLWAVDFSPVGNYIATGSRDGFVTLWRYKCKINDGETRSPAQL